MLDTFEIREGTMLAGRYRVIERLGAGGMATVYLAEDTVLGRSVAVKRMRSEPSGRHNTERFRREARLGASLSHPHVVTVFDTLAGEDGVLIVMEYVDGETLEEEIDRGRIEPERAIAILGAVASALDHAHAAGIVHRDVKPGNVLISREGTVKLADLGIATAAESTRITATNDIVGTLAYISPERLEASSPGGPESDVYSLAVLAWEMLSGEQFNRGSTPAEVLHRATTGPPPDLRKTWPDAPAGLALTLQEALHADPDCRPRSAGEFVDRLSDSLDAPGEEPDQLDDPTETMTAPTAVAAEPPPQRQPSELLDRAPTSGSPPLGDGPPAKPAGGRGPRVALLVMAGLALAGIAALAIALVGGGDDGRDSGERVASPSQKESGGEGGGASEAAAPAPEEPSAPAEPTEETTEAPAATGEDPAALNDQGFALLQEGDYEGAIPLLQRAVDSYPEGSTDLNYAYALYNLGNALRLAGRPEEAIPVLEQRLEIPNQTSTVERELELARQEAGEQ